MTSLWLNVVVPDTAQQISFPVPLSLPCLGFVLSHYWFSLICFSLKGSQRSTDSHLFSISCTSPRLSVLPALPTCEISSSDRRTQTVTPVQKSRGPARRGRMEGGLIQSTVSSLFRHFSINLTCEDGGTDDISDDYSQSFEGSFADALKNPLLAPPALSKKKKTQSL